VPDRKQADGIRNFDAVSYLSSMPRRPGESCLPTRGTKVPAGPEWLHEIKHDGYRLIVQREGKRVRLFTSAAGRSAASPDPSRRLPTRMPVYRDDRWTRVGLPMPAAMRIIFGAVTSSGSRSGHRGPRRISF
jgi:hypothetical protein